MFTPTFPFYFSCWQQRQTVVQEVGAHLHNGCKYEEIKGRAKETVWARNNIRLFKDSQNFSAGQPCTVGTLFSPTWERNKTYNQQKHPWLWWWNHDFIWHDEHVPFFTKPAVWSHSDSVCAKWPTVQFQLKLEAEFTRHMLAAMLQLVLVTQWVHLKSLCAPRSEDWGARSEDTRVLPRSSLLDDRWSLSA